MPGFCGSFSDRTGIQGDDSYTFDVRDGRSIAHGTQKWGPSTACPQVSGPLAVPPLPWVQRNVRIVGEEINQKTIPSSDGTQCTGVRKGKCIEKVVATLMADL